MLYIYVIRGLLWYCHKLIKSFVADATAVLEQSWHPNPSYASYIVNLNENNYISIINASLTFMITICVP